MTPPLFVPALGRSLYPGASVALDFTRNLYRSGTPVVKGSPSLLSGWTFTRASTGYAETAAGALVAFGSGAPRITDKGLLVEEARTNLALRSQEFDNATWVKTNFTVTADAAAAPDGTTTADLITATSTVGTVIQGSITVAATAATYTVYVKKGSQNTTATGSFLLRNVTTATILVNCVLTWATMTVSGTGASISAMADGWYRLTLTTSTGITSGDTISIYPGASGGAITVGDNWYLWGAQLEAGAFATSYIPTTTASATRAADVAKLTFASVPITTIVARAQVSSVTGTRYSLSLDDGTASEIAALIASNAALAGLVVDGGATQANIAAGSSTAAVSYGMAMRYGLNDCQFAATGILGTPDTSATMPTTTQIVFGDRGAGSRSLNGYLERALVYPRAFTDAELQAASL